MDTSKKIIKGAVNSRGFTITSAITQWDYGWQFIPEIEDLPPTYRLDFSNEEKHGTALPVYCSTDGAEVPTELIDTGKDIWVWYVAIGDGYGITEYKWRIPNKCKPKTEQDEPTPSQQSSIDQAISVVNDAVETVEQKASEADQSARESAESARASGESALSASNSALSSGEYASNALGYAESASASATASAQSASDAESARQETTSLAVEAQRYADASEQSATNAQTYALSANAASGTAENFADVASGYASQAQVSANTASTKATEASTSAQTASQKATEASQSATNASQSAQTAETAKMDAQTAQGLAESARDSAISAKEDAEDARDDAETARDEAQSAVASISGALADKAPVITDTASGSIASFSDGADDLPLKSLVVDINPVQDLHGQENPYPAGSTANQLDLIAATYTRCTLVDVYTGSVRVNITNFYFAAIVFQANAMLTAMMERILNGEPITFEMDNNNGYSASIVVYGTRSNGSSYQEINGYNNFVTITPTLFTAVTSIEFRFQRTGTPHTDTTTVITGLRVSYGDTATTFQPYENICPISGWTGMQLNANGTIIPISWQTEAGTVYGGKLDVLSGELTVYPYYASYNGETLTGEWISDRDKYVSGTTPTIGAQVVNIGAQGTEIQLEPHEVASLLGQNNIFADTGDSAVEYRANTKLYINKKIAEAISALS